jgi:hypothetical protein
MGSVGAVIMPLAQAKRGLPACNPFSNKFGESLNSWFY